MAEASLTDVVKELRKQNDTLVSVKTRLDQEARERQEAAAEQARKDADAARKENERQREAKSKSSGPATVQGALVAGLLDVVPGGGMLNDFFQKAMHFIFGAATVSALKRGFARFLGRGLGVFALTKLWENFNDQIFDGFYNLMGDYFPDSINQWFKDNRSIVESDIDDAVQRGLWGLMLGKKIGLLVFAGSLLGDFFTRALEKGGYIDADGTGTSEFINKILGTDFQIPNEFFVEYGTILAMMLAPSIIGPAFRGLLFVGGRVAGGLIPSLFANLKSNLKTSFGKGLGIGLAIGLTGEVAAQAIETYTNDEEYAKIVRDSATLAMAGSFFGIPGLIASALVGIAWAGARLIAKWFDDHQEDLYKSLDEQALRAALDYQTAAQNKDYGGMAAAAEKMSRIVQDSRPEDKERYLELLNSYTEDLERLRITGKLDEQGIQLLNNLVGRVEGLSAAVDISKTGMLASPEMMTALKDTQKNLQKTINAIEQGRTITDDMLRFNVAKAFQEEGLSTILSAEKQNELIDIITNRIREGTFTTIEELFKESQRERFHPVKGRLGKLLMNSIDPNFYQDKILRQPSVSVVNGGDTYNTAATSMVTNNGPAIDMSDHMIYQGSIAGIIK